jgi:hypothetical protein
MANGAALYKYVDGGRLGGSPGLGTPQGPAQYKQWTAAEVVPALAIRQNGGFVFSTVAGGTAAASGIGPTPSLLTDNTVTWVLVGSIGGLYASNDATQRFPLGAIQKGEDQGPNAYGEAEFRYVKFTGATAIKAGDFVAIDAQGQTATLTPAAGNGQYKVTVIGVAMAPQALNVATPTYGWVMVRGIFDGANVAGTFTVGTNLSGYSTAGAVEAKAGTFTVANFIFDGSVLRAGAAQYACTVELYWPICSGR